MSSHKKRSQSRPSSSSREEAGRRSAEACWGHSGENSRATHPSQSQSHLSHLEAGCRSAEARWRSNQGQDFESQRQNRTGQSSHSQVSRSEEGRLRSGNRDESSHRTQSCYGDQGYGRTDIRRSGTEPRWEHDYESQYEEQNQGRYGQRGLSQNLGYGHSESRWGHNNENQNANQGRRSGQQPYQNRDYGRSEGNWGHEYEDQSQERYGQRSPQGSSEAGRFGSETRWGHNQEGQNQGGYRQSPQERGSQNVWNRSEDEGRDDYNQGQRRGLLYREDTENLSSRERWDRHHARENDEEANRRFQPHHGHYMSNEREVDTDFENTYRTNENERRRLRPQGRNF